MTGPKSDLIQLKTKTAKATGSLKITVIHHYRPPTGSPSLVTCDCFAGMTASEKETANIYQHSEKNGLGQGKFPFGGNVQVFQTVTSNNL
jgi:hypothetical protein